MKKFKQIFYPIYLITALAVGYRALTGLGNPEAATMWFQSNFAPARQAHWILLILMLLAVLMLVEIVIENLRIRQLKNEVADQAEEIVRLKAKLFDKAEGTGNDASDEDED